MKNWSYTLFLATLVIANVSVVASGQGTKKTENAHPASSHRVGIVPEMPSEKPFVKVEGGYMVPFKMKIPGSDVQLR